MRSGKMAVRLAIGFAQSCNNNVCRMKLEPKAKPVRIRIKSGGEEHSTLESLKRNFSVDDLKTAVEDKRLSRWLKQQGQNELAEGVLRYQGKMKSLSGNDYLGFIKLFFANEPDIEKVKDDYSLAGFFHDKKMEKNFDRVFNRCCESKSYAIVYNFYSTFKGEKTADFWIERFEDFKVGLEHNDLANCLFELAVLYGEQDMPIKKIRSLFSAIALSSKDAEKELQNMTQSNFGMEVNALNSPNDWLNLLEKFEKNVDHSGKCEFLRDLSTAYKSVGDLNRTKQFLTEAAQMGDKESAELLLEGADFMTVKTLYETPGSKGLFSPQEWLDVFKSIEGMVDEADKIEYNESLYWQYLKLGNKELAEKCRQEWYKRKVENFFGVRDNINPEKSLYPKFTECLNNSVKKYDIENLCHIDFYGNDAQNRLFEKYVDIAKECCKDKDLTVTKILSLFSYVNNMYEYYFKENKLCQKLHSFLKCLFEEFFLGRKSYYGELQGKLGYLRYKYSDQDVNVFANNGFSCLFPKIGIVV